MVFTSILILIVAKALPLIRISSIHFTRISAIIFLISGLLNLNTLYIQSIGSGIGIYSGLFQITSITQTMELFIYLIGFLILISWPLKKIKIKQSDYSTNYSIVVLFSTLGSSFLLSSFDLISLYLSIELQSFGLYVLSTLYRDSESSTNAGLKYFLLGGLSSCIILLGSGILYSYTGLTQFESIYTLISITNIQYIIQGSLLGIVIIIIGLLFKISAAPLHNWSPDVYDETPTIVTIWLTIMPKIALLIIILEIYININVLSSVDNLIINITGYLTNIPNSNSINIITNNINLTTENKIIEESTISVIKNILLISSVLSLLIGTIVGLAQVKIKRLLAYSTISHIGFMLLALAINTEQSIDSFLFYIIQYTITNLNIFLILLAISYLYKQTLINKSIISIAPKGFLDIKYIRDLKSLFIFNPLLSLSLSISLFSMAGIPPLIGFFSKQFVLYSALDNGYYFLSLLAIIVSVISASYYLKIIKILHMPSLPTNTFLNTTGSTKANNSKINNQPNTNINLIVEENNEDEIEGNELSQFHSLLISILSLFILFFILKPSLILNSTQVLSLTLFKL